jgi:hypothetical protein
MYYFDNDFLSQYFDQGIAVKVFVDGEYYDIAGKSDIEDTEFGIGYTLQGRPHTFDYRSIEQIKAGNNIITKDHLQSKIDGVEEPEGGEEDMDGEDGGMDDLGGADGGGEPAPEGGGEEAPPEEDEEPPMEGYTPRELMGMMLSEAKAKKNTAKTGFVKGNMVENIDMLCEFHGSRGSVTNVDMPDSDDGLVMVEYRIFNYGYNFKPGQKVIKSSKQLQKIDSDE